MRQDHLPRQAWDKHREGELNDRSFRTALEGGSHSAEDMLGAMRSEQALSRWLNRLLGWMLAWIGANKFTPFLRFSSARQSRVRVDHLPRQARDPPPHRETSPNKMRVRSCRPAAVRRSAHGACEHFARANSPRAAVRRRARGAVAVLRDLRCGDDSDVPHLRRGLARAQPDGGVRCPRLCVLLLLLGELHALPRRTRRVEAPPPQPRHRQRCRVAYARPKLQTPHHAGHLRLNSIQFGLGPAGPRKEDLSFDLTWCGLTDDFDLVWSGVVWSCLSTAGCMPVLPPGHGCWRWSLLLLDAARVCSTKATCLATQAGSRSGTGGGPSAPLRS
jgi:hypothetical protein